MSISAKHQKDIAKFHASEDYFDTQALAVVTRCLLDMVGDCFDDIEELLKRNGLMYSDTKEQFTYLRKKYDRFLATFDDDFAIRNKMLYLHKWEEFREKVLAIYVDTFKADPEKPQENFLSEK